MPKITITDTDQAARLLSEYNSFVPLIIGAYDANKEAAWQAAADDNGVYFCDSIQKFKNNVGLVNCVENGSIEALYATLEQVNPADIAPASETHIPTYSSTLSQDEFNNRAPFIYTATQVSEAPSEHIGYFKYLAAGASNPTYYQLTKAISYVAATEYVIVTYLGREAGTSTNAGFYGNQIAYELLATGTPVLYLGISSASINATFTNINTLKEITECLQDRTVYDFRFILHGIYKTNTSISNVIKANADAVVAEVATSRDDCIALLDINDSVYAGATTLKDKIDAAKRDTDDMATVSKKNVAVFTPGVRISNLLSSITAYGDNDSLPASFYYLTCFYKAQENGFAEWYAAAGESRGISGYNIIDSTVKFGDIAVNALEPRASGEGTPSFAVNVLSKVGSRYMLWGNRTALGLGTELKYNHFLNIRQLVYTLQKQLYASCRKFTFDPNSDILWINFCNAIRPTLERMKDNEGIRDYAILKIATDKLATLKARVRIVPIEAVEDFEIDITLENSLTGVAVGVED